MLVQKIKKNAKERQVIKIVKERDGVKEVEKACKAVLRLTNDDMNAMDAIAQEQIDYNHPLRMGTVRWQGELGIHNKMVMSALRNLHKVLRDGANIQKP